MDSVKPTSRGLYRDCPRCHFKRYRSLFSASHEICNRCRYGDFRMTAREYETKLDMRQASVFSRVPLTRKGVRLALEQMKILPAPELKYE